MVRKTSYNNAIKFLAEDLADREIWDFSDVQEKKHAILKNYSSCIILCAKEKYRLSNTD